MWIQQLPNLAVAAIFKESPLLCRVQPIDESIYCLGCSTAVQLYCVDDMWNKKVSAVLSFAGTDSLVQRNAQWFIDVEIEEITPRFRRDVRWIES